MDVIDRFFSYVSFDTQSDENSTSCPSTEKEMRLAEALVQELQSLGLSDARMDKHGCVYAHLHAAPGQEMIPALGFIAHMDTSPDAPGANVRPRRVLYRGGDLPLDEAGSILLDAQTLTPYAGQELIVTDGTTLLGADDKAGIAEIVSAAAYLLEHPEIPHGPICIAFTPDEEIGRGTEHFDLSAFGASAAYTVDGGTLGELEYENFNAAGAKLHVYGRSVHPGSAKGKMKNAILIAQEFQKLLPVEQNPMYTEGYEGFFHLDALSGNVEEVTADYIIRDHNRQLFEQKKELFMSCADFLNRKYGEGTVVVDVKDSYYNMREIMEQHMHLIDNAKAAMEELGIEPKVSPIRGGTDGARLSFMGLPCPNLCTGGENYHGRYEYACVQSMEKTTELLIAIAAKYVNR